MINDRRQSEKCQHDDVGNVIAVDFHSENRQNQTDQTDQKRIFDPIFCFQRVQPFVSLTNVTIGTKNQLSQFTEALIVAVQQMRSSAFETVENVKRQTDEHDSTERSQTGPSDGIENDVADQKGGETGVTIVPKNEPFDAMKGRFERKNDVFHDLKWREEK